MRAVVALGAGSGFKALGFGAQGYNTQGHGIEMKASNQTLRMHCAVKLEPSMALLSIGLRGLANKGLGLEALGLRWP